VFRKQAIAKKKKKAEKLTKKQLQQQPLPILQSMCSCKEKRRKIK